MSEEKAMQKNENREAITDAQFLALLGNERRRRIPKRAIAVVVVLILSAIFPISVSNPMAIMIALALPVTTLVPENNILSCSFFYSFS